MSKKWPRKLLISFQLCFLSRHRWSQSNRLQWNKMNSNWIDCSVDEPIENLKQNGIKTVGSDISRMFNNQTLWRSVLQDNNKKTLKHLLTFFSFISVSYVRTKSCVSAFQFFKQLSLRLNRQRCVHGITATTTITPASLGRH